MPSFPAAVPMPAERPSMRGPAMSGMPPGGGGSAARALPAARRAIAQRVRACTRRRIRRGSAPGKDANSPLRAPSGSRYRRSTGRRAPPCAGARSSGTAASSSRSSLRSSATASRRCTRCPAPAARRSPIRTIVPPWRRAATGRSGCATATGSSSGRSRRRSRASSRARSASAPCAGASSRPRGCAPGRSRISASTARPRRRAASADPSPRPVRTRGPPRGPVLDCRQHGDAQDPQADARDRPDGERGDGPAAGAARPRPRGALREGRRRRRAVHRHARRRRHRRGGPGGEAARGLLGSPRPRHHRAHEGAARGDRSLRHRRGVRGRAAHDPDRPARREAEEGPALEPGRDRALRAAAAHLRGARAGDPRRRRRDPAHRRARGARARGGAARLRVRGRPLRRGRPGRLPEGERRLRAEAAGARAGAARVAAPGDAVRALRRAAAVLALAAAVYVLPVPGILRRLGERRAALSLDALEVQGSLLARGDAAERIAGAAPRAGGEASAPARFLMKVPGRCRLEVVRPGAPDTERPFVSVRDGKVTGPLADLPSIVAFARALCTLLAAPSSGDASGVFAGLLTRRGVGLTEATLGRFDGRIAYVVGGRAKDTKPLLFVEKDGFRPLRLVAPEGKELLDVRLLGWGSPTGGDWFPRAVEVWAKDATLLRFTTERATANPRLAEQLFP